MREYIAFESQPEGLIFRLDYTGIFEGSNRTTKSFKQGARTWSIAILGR